MYLQRVGPPPTLVARRRYNGRLLRVANALSEAARDMESGSACSDA